MPIFFVILIGISLSMDAFSLSLAYGMQNIEKKEKKKLSYTVGIFHFFMPLFGYFFGNMLLHFIYFEPKVIIFIFFLMIGIEMLISKKEEVSVKNKLAFSFAVSLDSFSVGMGLKAIYNPFIAAILFMIISFIFTYLGLLLGGKLYKVIGNKCEKLGGIVFIILSFFFYLK